jgi:hypothetical protein
MESSPNPSGHAPKLKRPPSPLAWKALLALGILGRVAAESQATDARARESEARAAAQAEQARAAAEEARRGDSVRLAAAVDSGARLSAPRAWQVDETLHNASLTIPHETVHRRVVSLQMDSTARLLKRAAKNPTYTAAARQILTLVQAPLTKPQERRQNQLSTQLSQLDRRLALEASRREARAGLRAQSLQPAQPRQVQPLRSRVPPGASARCADGTYSFSASRRGTCSHHGGVAEWL